MKYSKLVLLILFLSTFILNAETFVADSCSQSDVQDAVDLASTGDTVTVPAGECTWSSEVTLSNDAAIILQGAGIGSTIINTSGIETNRSGSRITGFTFNEGKIIVDGDGWRVDHCYFHATSVFSAGVSVEGTRSTAEHPTGLVDNCSFYNKRVLIKGSKALFSEADYQHKMWTIDLALGGFTNIVYVEDCDFESDVKANAIDANYGGAYVFRFNHIIEGPYIEAHSVQGENRATRRWEIYNNQIDNPGDSIYYPYRIRAGTGVIFNDSLSGNWTYEGIGLDNVRSYTDSDGGGYCDGDSTWDGNEDATGYPCRDQIGRGPDDPQWVVDPAGSYTQPLVPAYMWENRTADTSLISVDVLDVDSAEHIQADRDYYTQGISFDGTSGVGSGVLASIPATCTAGVGYWATDQGDWNATGDDGVLYKCTSTDTWEVYYEPYTYPHPLRCYGRRGDANLSETITIADVVAVLKHIAGTATLEGLALTAADADEDSDVDGDDVTRILQHITGDSPLEY